MRKWMFTLAVLTIFGFGELAAQSYNSAVGLRAGYLLTGTYKKFIKDNHAIEAYAGIGSYYWGGVVVGGLYQIHKELASVGVDNLYWYYGGGAYAGIGSGYFDAGLNLNIGLDYKFEDFPINVSLDWAPGVNLIGGIHPTWVTGGFAVRYVLDK
jgi:hypothetical protein